MFSVRQGFMPCLAQSRQPNGRTVPDHRDRLSATRSGLLILVTSLLLVTTSVTSRAHEVEDVIHWNARLWSVLAVSGQNNTIQTRSLAMAHAAIHDALNAIEPRYEPYAVPWCAVPWASPEAAIAAAAHGVLHGVIPNFGTPAQQAAAIAAANSAYAAAIATIPKGPARAEGIRIGDAAATAILAIRSKDGALLADGPYVPLAGPGSGSPRQTRTRRIPRMAELASRHRSFRAGATSRRSRSGVAISSAPMVPPRCPAGGTPGTTTKCRVSESDCQRHAAPNSPRSRGSGTRDLRWGGTGLPGSWRSRGWSTSGSRRGCSLS